MVFTYLDVIEAVEYLMSGYLNTQDIREPRTGKDLATTLSKAERGELMSAEDVYERTVGKRGDAQGLHIELYTYGIGGVAISCDSNLRPTSEEVEDGKVFVGSKRMGSPVFVHGPWEEVLQELLTRAQNSTSRKTFEAEAIEAHWNYYRWRGLIAEDDSLWSHGTEEAVAIIREARKRSLKDREPRLFEQDDNGEHLYLSEVLEYAKAVLSYLGSGGLVYAAYEEDERRSWVYEDFGIKLQAISNGQVSIWYDKRPVFHSERLYEIVPGVGDEVKQTQFLYAEDYADFASLFVPGDWEYVLEKLYNVAKKTETEIAKANAEAIEAVKLQQAKREELRAFWDDVRQYAYWYLQQASGIGEAEDDQIKIVLADDVVLSLHEREYYGIGKRKVRWKQIGFYGPYRDASDEWWYPHMCELIEKAKAFANANRPTTEDYLKRIDEAFGL